jgi:hypothetical protein
METVWEPKRREHPPLEAITRELMKTQLNEKISVCHSELQTVKVNELLQAVKVQYIWVINIVMCFEVDRHKHVHDSGYEDGCRLTFPW